jgi:hypothetical protein
VMTWESDYGTAPSPTPFPARGEGGDFMIVQIFLHLAE